MFYASNKCVCTEVYKPEHVYKFRGPCLQCKVEQLIAVKAKELFAYNQGKLIQEAIPSLNAGQREFLISGICSDCFDKMFKENE